MVDINFFFLIIYLMQKITIIHKFFSVDIADQVLPVWLTNGYSGIH